VVVDHLGPRAGEQIVDLGCGTGNATLLVAAAGAEVLGVDPSTRLLEVAAQAAADADLDATFAEGDAADLPVEDGSLDAIVSVFGLIFAPDAPAAAAELARSLRSGGRVVSSAWVPEGAIAEQMGLRRAVMADLDQPLGPAPFPWHDQAAVAELLAPHGFEVSLHRHDLAFTAESPEAFVREQMATHPLWLETRAVVEPTGRWDALVADVLAHFASWNEDPAGFRVTSGYAVATASLVA
jgi:ubiquinone/menaquinone biosynthesis C-methylase UbiE